MNALNLNLIGELGQLIENFLSLMEILQVLSLPEKVKRHLLLELILLSLLTFPLPRGLKCREAGMMFSI